MARNVTQRAAQRGFPVYDTSGQTGQGALHDAMTTPPSAGLPTAPWTDRSQDPGSVPAAMPPPQEYVLGASLWGLPAAPDPDDTPRTHAAPFADPTLPIGEYYAEADAAHAGTFSGVAVRNDVGTLLRMPQDHPGIVEGSPPGPLQPLTGQIRKMGGRDGVQGYGGGGKGIGGTNEPPLTVDDNYFPGQTWTTFLSAAEVPFLTAGGDQFIPSAPEFGPWRGGGYDGPTVSVLAQGITSADTPAQGPALPAAALAAPAYAGSFWGG